MTTTKFAESPSIFSSEYLLRATWFDVAESVDVASEFDRVVRFPIPRGSSIRRNIPTGSSSSSLSQRTSWEYSTWLSFFDSFQFLTNWRGTVTDWIIVSGQVLSFLPFKGRACLLRIHYL